MLFVWGSVAVVVVACFVNWGSVMMKPFLPTGFAGDIGGFGSQSQRVLISGWRDHSSPLGFDVQNWMVVVFAGAYAYLFSIRLFVKAVSSFFVVMPALLGYAHSMYLFVVLLLGTQSTLGPGLFFVVATFGAFLTVEWIEWRRRRRQRRRGQRPV